MSILNQGQRRGVLWKVVTTTQQQFADPMLNGVDLSALAASEERAIVTSTDDDEFERRINALLQRLGTSHLGFFHERRPRSPGRIAIAATFMKSPTADGERWVFQDVHPGGVAALAGISSGDILLTVSGKEITQPEAPLFALGSTFEVVVRKRNGETAKAELSVPSSKEKKRPLVVPEQVVTAKKLDGDIAHLRVSMFPGVLGMDVARDISRAISDLECPRLIVDLRGNTGGGIGCLRLMSHMCADKRGVGYSVGREHRERGYDKKRLPRFDRIPQGKLGVVPLILRFATAGRSIAVFSEGLGKQRHHGRVAVLVNEHSASASEMVAAFAADYKLATLVGAKTPGRLVGANSFKVGHGYRLALPVATYFTWQDQTLEGRGIVPDREVPLSATDLAQGADPQFETARAAVAA